MTILEEPLTTVLLPAAEPRVGFVAAPVDAEMMDGYRLADGVLDTHVELPAPPVPLMPPLEIEPPVVAPPRFEQLWRHLFTPLPGDTGADTAPEQTAMQAGKSGRVVTVFSPKGGTGATTVVTNLAVLLAGGGRSVCVVDLDLEFGDVSIMTGLAPVHSLVDAVDTALDDATLGSLVTRWRPGADCVLAPVDPSAAERIGSQLVTGLLTALRSRYDYVVVDTPSQLSEQVLDALDAADHQVIVTTPQLPALKSTRLVLDTLQLLGYDPARRAVLVNQVGARTLDAAEVAEAISHPVAGSLPASADVAGAVDAGVPLAAQRSDHPVVHALASFTTDVITGEPAGSRPRSARLWRHR
jgi:pilus assembly protein CpaE